VKIWVGFLDSLHESLLLELETVEHDVCARSLHNLIFMVTRFLSILFGFHDILRLFAVLVYEEAHEGQNLIIGPLQTSTGNFSDLLSLILSLLLQLSLKLDQFFIHESDFTLVKLELYFKCIISFGLT
jgi:hypothetical protein